MLLFHSHYQVQRSLAQCYIQEMYWLNDYVLVFNCEIYWDLLGVKGLIAIMVPSITVKPGFSNVSHLQQFSSWLSFLQKNVLVVEQNFSGGKKRENAWVKVCLPLNLTFSMSQEIVLWIFIEKFHHDKEVANFAIKINLSTWFSGWVATNEPGGQSSIPGQDTCPDCRLNSQ